MPIEKMKFHRR